MGALTERLSSRELGLLGCEAAQRTAVLVTLQHHREGGWHVLLERRSTTLRRQPGEICFPGGHRAPQDSDMAATAVRETCEELGVRAADIDLVGPLDLLVASSGLLVYPFVGRLRPSAALQPNRDEVGAVHAIPLADLLALAPQVHDVELVPHPSPDFPYHLLPGGASYPLRRSVRRHFFYVWQDVVIWGLTAHILHHFLDLARSVNRP